tara:strand:+ start:1410 stop:1568 length:159 start_codon:yes stop_codon:yes gene_type:complete
MGEEDDVKDHGDKIKIVGRWHKFGGRGGYVFVKRRMKKSYVRGCKTGKVCVI